MFLYNLDEVLEVARKEDQLELSKLKEELLRGFREQMECRRTLMEINHNAMEVSRKSIYNIGLVYKPHSAYPNMNKRKTTDI